MAFSCDSSSLENILAVREIAWMILRDSNKQNRILMIEGIMTFSLPIFLLTEAIELME